MSLWPEGLGFGWATRHPCPASTAFPMPPPRLLGGAVLRVGSTVDKVDFRARAEASRTSQAQGLGF